MDLERAAKFIASRNIKNKYNNRCNNYNSNNNKGHYNGDYNKINDKRQLQSMQLSTLRLQSALIVLINNWNNSNSNNNKSDNNENWVNITGET